MSGHLAQGIRWDLSDLYTSIQDPKIASDLKEAEVMALDLESRYKPRFEKADGSLSSWMPVFLKDYKTLVTLMTRLGVFAHLSFAAETHDPALGAFLQKIQVALTDIQTHLLFFEVRWNKLDKTLAEQCLADPALSADRHFLEKLRCYTDHTLSEGEEKIMAVKANTSSQAFARLFDEVVNRIPFFIEQNGKKTKKTEGEILALLHSPERLLRKTASESLAEGLKNNTHLLTYIFNMILADHRDSLKLRHFKHPMDAMNLSNEIDLESVRDLIAAVKEAYPLAARYYRLKRGLLGLDKLYDYDRYAALPGKEEALDFKKCRDIILAGYYGFSGEAGKIAERFFTERWIDAEVREGKQGGGFCCQTTPDLHPYILVNYTGTVRDVMTVAHELGHGLHQVLSQKAGILESSAPLTMAETASVFGEMLIFDQLFDNEKDPGNRLALLCGKIDDNFSTVFRQVAMTDFELSAHESGLKEGELSSEVISDLWMRANAAMYGDSVTLTENYRHGWKYIPHFIHSPFYCYAYAFAQLFVLSLYAEYRKNKTAFVPRYLEMLSLGGSKKPGEIAAVGGIDIHRPGFWRSGLQFLEEMVARAETLASKE
ncbi:MAG: M3 family oligoendopeptidase [Candidatus Omnitrophica bacterium]|nr:M3 family oligoendopeptidase [Candidatus Omnitrophota bacterium]